MISLKKTTEMKIKYKLLEATFINRPNRFLTRVEYNGNIIESHLPDPGRLKELLIPGAKVLLKKETGQNRKTSFSTQAIYAGDILVSLNTWMPNKFVSYLLKNQYLSFLKNWALQTQEVKYGKNRFDFQLTNNNQTMVLEIKSVSLIENGVAKFPDAITERGKRHVIHLGDMAKKGLNTMVIFVVQRSDAISFQPQWERDPEFSNALFKAWGKGLQVHVIKLKINMDSIEYIGEIPYKLNPTL